MSYQQRYEVYYIEDDYEMEELDYFVDEFQGVDLGGFDSVEDELHGIDLDDFDLDVDELLDVGLGGFDSDVDEYDYMNKRIHQKRSAKPRRKFQRVDLGGFDSDVDELQGIDLDDFDLDIDEFLCIDLGDFDSDVHEYDYMNKRMQDISVVELRNLVWAPSKYDVYLMSHFSIIDWSSLTCAKTEILNLSWDVAPLENHPESFLEELKETLARTLVVKDKIFVTNGLHGELIVKYLDKT
ncbi:uncharacterized protein [Solanum tuberosum]|uniref:uncharacterized protein n=1 Tax=Solanum tuberosum TaxID=4113 RepID=UPI00073A0272|nr:PREDICTED: uncharacterized protein LOC107061839 [Solanum tuberosum]